MKSVLITGCTPGGIGYALAKEYQAKGLRVFATARQQRVLTELTALCPGVETLATRSARDAVASITGGTLDILVNNAGQGHYGVPCTDLDMEEVKRVYEVNVFGVMRVVQEFAPLLIASGNGKIVNIGSVVGMIPLPFNSSAYNSSKAALHAYGNTLRLELAPFNVQVTTVITGGVHTNMIISAATSPTPLKPSSIYTPIKHLITNQLSPEAAAKTMMSPEVYATYVVRQTLKRTVRAWLWYGTYSWFVWLVDTFFIGRTGFDRLCRSQSGLSELEARLGHGKGKQL
ncbi:NAD-P-binding protein [Roridomyces roridus]|uniref:NAD-P-binding protein n=1 Tax=Roridomyces roridus TaxID=1738132 RepID=A0AAD7F7P3_9AGAR|nr:NAD-P-binding protein [Roridomyces roridus]